MAERLRFLIFAGEDYSTGAGGWLDYQGAAVSVDEAKRLLVALIQAGDVVAEWWHIVDSDVGQIVAQQGDPLPWD